MTNLTPEIAGKIYDILIEHASAPNRGEYDRSSFIHSQSSKYVPEYRFMGALGFGGKFWRDSPLFGNTDTLAETWYVDTYREDMTPEREKIIENTNAALAALNEEIACPC